MTRWIAFPVEVRRWGFWYLFRFWILYIEKEGLQREIAQSHSSLGYTCTSVQKLSKYSKLETRGVAMTRIANSNPQTKEKVPWLVITLDWYGSTVFWRSLENQGSRSWHESSNSSEHGSHRSRDTKLILITLTIMYHGPGFWIVWTVICKLLLENAMPIW